MSIYILIHTVLSMRNKAARVKKNTQCKDFIIKLDVVVFRNLDERFWPFYWINGAKKGRVDFEALVLLKLSLLRLGTLKANL